jgi:hypothetical protein
MRPQICSRRGSVHVRERPVSAPPRDTVQVAPHHRQLRRVCGVASAQFDLVYGRALEIWTSSSALECVVEAAGRPDLPTTNHDRDHACVVSFIFHRLSRFQSLACRTAVLLFRDGSRRRIATDMGHARKMLSRALSTRADPEQLKLAIPAPLVGFLASDRVRGK